METIKTSSGQTVTTPDEKIPGMTYEQQASPQREAQPPTVTTDDITAGNATNVQAQSKKQQKNLEGVQNTLKDTSVYGKVATPGFINAAFQAKYGRDANEDEQAKVGANEFALGGATVKDVVGRLGLDQHLSDYGLGAEDKPGENKESGSNQNVSDQVIDTEKPTKENFIDRSTNAYLDQLEKGEASVTELGKKVRESQANMDGWEAKFGKSEYDDTNETLDAKSEYRKKRDAIEALNIPEVETQRMLSDLLTETNRAMEEMGDEQARGRADDAFNYTMDSIQHRMLSGQYTDAVNLMNNASTQLRQNEELRIKQAESESIISSREADDLRAEASAEDEKRQAGWAYIKPENVEAMIDRYDMDRVYTNPVTGKSYLLPEKENTDAFTFVPGGDGSPGGYLNTETGEFQLFDGTGAGVVATSTGDRYDIGSYATDPNHERSVQNILSKIGQLETVSDIDQYIKSTAPDSKITGQMVANASEKHGVSWEMIVAIMQQDSSLGTKGLGARNNNPGNVGQFDSLGTNAVDGYATLQEGVDAVAENLAWRKIASEEVKEDFELSGYISSVKEGRLTVKQALDEVTEEKKPQLIYELSKIKTDGETMDDIVARDKMRSALDLKNHAGLNSSVGPVPGTRTAIIDKFGAKDDFLGKVDNLIEGLSLESLIEAKSRGATFGALSNEELKMLSKSATSLGSWRVQDEKTKKTKYFDIDEKSFKDELDNIYKLLSRAVGSDMTSDGTSEKDPIGVLGDDLGLFQQSDIANSTSSSIF